MGERLFSLFVSVVDGGGLRGGERRALAEAVSAGLACPVSPPAVPMAAGVLATGVVPIGV